jgi:gamma-glutamyl-gamma-aminobutyrate hydrolase PuuD
MTDQTAGLAISKTQPQARSIATTIIIRACLTYLTLPLTLSAVLEPSTAVSGGVDLIDDIVLTGGVSLTLSEWFARPSLPPLEW